MTKEDYHCHHCAVRADEATAANSIYLSIGFTWRVNKMSWWREINYMNLVISPWFHHDFTMIFNILLDVQVKNTIKKSSKHPPALAAWVDTFDAGKNRAEEQLSFLPYQRVRNAFSVRTNMGFVWKWGNCLQIWSCWVMFLWFFTKISDNPTYISCNVVDIHTHHHERSMTWVATSEIDGSWTHCSAGVSCILGSCATADQSAAVGRSSSKDYTMVSKLEGCGLYSVAWGMHTFCPAFANFKSDDMVMRTRGRMQGDSKG